MNKQHNDRTTRDAVAALNAKIQEIAFRDFPNALRAVGGSVIADSKQTHEYQNRTGKLEDGHDFEVVEPGQTKTVRIETRNGSDELALSSPSHQVTLFLFTRQQYGLWVETVWGYSVLINSFLKLRHSFTKIFKSAFTSKLVK